MRDLREPDDNDRRREIALLLSLGAVDSTVNASISQCHGRDGGRRSSAPGRGVVASTAVAIALQGAGLGPRRRRTVVACECVCIGCEVMHHRESPLTEQAFWGASCQSAVKSPSAEGPSMACPKNCAPGWE